MDMTIKIQTDELIQLIEDNKDEFSSIEKKKIIELLCSKNRGCTDNARLIANVVDLLCNN